MAKAVGIDLGTTNSVIAVLEGGDPTVVANAEGARTTPSVVAFKEGEVLVGEVAKRQAITNPDNTIRSVKRHMGTGWYTDAEGRRYTSQEVSARILMKLKRDAEAYLGAEVSSAVVTVPAYFNDAPAAGHQGGRPGRRARKCCGSSTNPPPPLSPTGSTRRTPSRPSSCSIWGEAPSMSRSWRSGMACSR